MMRLFRLAPALLLSAACAPAPAITTSPAVVSASHETVVYTLRQGSATLLTEHSRRSGERLEVELSLTSGARVEFEAELRPDASVAWIGVRQFAAETPPGGGPAMESTGRFRGSTVQLTMTRDGATESSERETVPGAVVFMNPSPTLMEQVVRRARVIGGTRVEVPVWSTAAGGQNYTATVDFTAPDAAVLTLGDAQIMIRTDAEGRLLAGTIPAQGLTIERTPAGER